MKINPMQLIQMMKNGNNPQQLMLNLLQQNNNNPLMANLIQMAQSNDAKGIETFARNLMKEKGIDFDKEFNTFRKTLGI